MRAVPISACRVCRCPNLAPFLDLGEMAPCGVFPNSIEDELDKEPLNVVRCLDCGLVQLAHDLPPEDTFGHGFGYRSATNPTMRAHLGSLAKLLMEVVAPEVGDLIIDIGSNDGTFLNALPAHLNRVGVDPVGNAYIDQYLPQRIDLHPGFWSDAMADNYVGKAAAVTCFACLYDLPDPNAFIAAVAKVLKPGGVFLCEMAGLPTMLATNGFDLISHEHLMYFHWHPLDRLLRPHGLAIDWSSVAVTPVNGGSMLVTARKTSEFIEPWASHQPSGDAIAKFKLGVQQSIAHVRGFLMGAQAEGKIVHGLCASTRGNTLLQAVGANPGCVQAISDSNPDKWGRVTPGTGITIISPENSRGQAPDFYLCLAWHYTNLTQDERPFLDRGGVLVYPFPHTIRYVTKQMVDA